MAIAPPEKMHTCAEKTRTLLKSRVKRSDHGNTPKCNKNQMMRELEIIATRVCRPLDVGIGKLAK